MKKGLNKLNKHVFDALERLENTNDENVEVEIKKCNAVSQLGRVVIDTVKAQTEIVKLQEKGNDFADYIMESLGLEDE